MASEPKGRRFRVDCSGWAALKGYVSGFRGLGFMEKLQENIGIFMKRGPKPCASYIFILNMGTKGS